MTDIERYQALVKATPWWRIGSTRVKYSEAPDVFKLAEVLREQGHDPTNFARTQSTGDIDLSKRAVQVSIGFGIACAAASVAIGYASEWLYVEPALGWYVAAIAAALAASASIVWSKLTRCDGSSIAGASITGALGFAFFAVMATPDLSAQLFNIDHMTSS